MKKLWAVITLLVTLSVVTVSATVLKSVTHTVVPGGLNVEIILDGQLKYAVSKMDNPARLIVDFQSTTIEKKFETVKINIGGIQEIRIAQFQKNIARVVVQMSDWYQYYIEKKDNSLVIRFTSLTSTNIPVTHTIQDNGTKQAQLKMIDIIKDGSNKVKVFIEFEDTFNYTVKEDKKKYIVEVYNVKNLTGKNDFAGDGDVIEKVAVQDIGEKDLSLNINLINEYPANIEKGPKSLVITFDKEVTSQRTEILDISSVQVDNRVTLRFKANAWLRFEEEQLPKDEKIRLTFENAAIDDKLLNIPIRKGAVVEVMNSRKGNSVISDIRLNNNITYKIYREDKDIVMDIDMIANQVTDSSMSEKKSKKIKLLSVQKQDISLILTSLAQQSGYNIIMSQSVRGQVTLELHDISWDVALDIILRTNGYAYQIQDNIIRVATPDEFKKEIDAQKKQNEMIDLGPTETRIVPISYSTAAEIAKMLEATLLLKPYIDTRTNSLILTGNPDKLDEAVNMVKYMDKPIPQVMIESKFIRVSTSVLNQLGIKWQSNNNTSFITDKTFADTVTSGGSDLNYSNTGFSGQIVTSLLDTFDINMKISMLVDESKAEIMANPSVTTMSGMTAYLQNGKSIPLAQKDESGNTISTLTDIGIKLDVKPLVNANNEVILEIRPEVSDLAPPASGATLIIAKNTASTTLMVKDGKTAVIAGLVRIDKTNASSGVPILKDIPILGLLFKNRVTRKDSEEIIIFVTPHIIYPSTN